MSEDDSWKNMTVETSPLAPIEFSSGTKEYKKQYQKNKNVVELYKWVKENENNVDYLENKFPIPEFDQIFFFEGPHLYSIYGMYHRSSMTSFVHGFFKEFDEHATIERIVNSGRWKKDTRYKYFRMSRQEISDQWETTRQDASFRGTVMHASIEYLYNKIYHPLLQNPVDIGEEYFWISIFEKMEVEGKFEPFRTELRVYDMDYELCGSVDMLYRKKNRAEDGSEDHDLYMFDWKRSKKIDDSAFDSGDYGRGPANSMPNCNKYHYFCQLNGYKYLIEKNTKYVVKEMYLGVFHPNHSKPEAIQERARKNNTTVQNTTPYLKIRVPERQKQVRVMCLLRRHNLLLRDLQYLGMKFKILESRYFENQNGYSCPEEAGSFLLDHFHHFFRLAIRMARPMDDCLQREAPRLAAEPLDLYEKIIEKVYIDIMTWSKTVIDNAKSISEGFFVKYTEEKEQFKKLVDYWEETVVSNAKTLSFSANKEAFKYIPFASTDLGIPKLHEGQKCKKCYCCDRCIERFERISIK